MTYVECKEWLKTYKDMYFRVKYIENYMIGLKSIPFGKEMFSSDKSKTKEDLILEKDELMAKMKVIEHAIAKIEDLKLICVIEYKYIDLMSFDEISDVMNYSQNTIKKFYGRAMNKIMKSVPKNT